MTPKKQTDRKGRRRLRLSAIISGGVGTILVGLLGFPLEVLQKLGYPIGYPQKCWAVALSWLGLSLLVLGFILAGLVASTPEQSQEPTTRTRKGQR